MRHKQQRLLEQNIQYLETYIKEHELKISPEEMILSITEADPDWQNFKNSKWLIKNLLNKNFLWEDIESGKQSKAFDTLNRFVNIRKQWNDSSIKDIQAYKGLSGIAEVIRPFEITKSMGELKREEKAKIYSETIVVYDKNDYLVVIPKTQEASCFWGRHTEWCTASTKSMNYFDTYNPNGPLIIAITPDNRKYQFHKNSEPMDENDKPIKNITDPVLVKLGLLTGQLYALKAVDYKNPEHLRLGLQINGNLIQDVSPDIENYLEFCKIAIHQNNKSIQHILPNSFADFQDYCELCKIAIEEKHNTLQYISHKNFIGESSHIEDYWELCRFSILQSPYTIKNINPEIFNNVEDYLKLCEVAVKKDGLTLQHIPKEYRTENLYKLALRNDGYALEHISPDVEGYFELCKLAIKSNEYTIEYVPHDTEGYFELCKLALRNDGYAIINISPDVEGYFELCKLAVQNSGLAIDDVCSETEGYVELCKLAIQNNGLAIRHIDKDLPEFFEICKLAVNQNGYALTYISPNTEGYFELCKVAVQKNDLVLRNIPSKTKEFFELCELAIQKSESVLEHISPDDFTNREDYLKICQIALCKKEGSILMDKTPINKENYLELYKFALSQNQSIIRHISPDTEGYFELCKLAVQNDGYAINHINPHTENYSELCKIIVQNKGSHINSISSKHFEENSQIEVYLELCKLALQNNPKSINCIPKKYHEKLKSDEELKSIIKIEEKPLSDWLKNKDYDKIIDSFNLLEQENPNKPTLKQNIELS